MRNAALTCLALVCSLGAAAAGEADPADPETPDAAEWMRRVEARDRDLETRHVGLARVRLSYPQKLSAALGLMRVRQPREYDCRTVCDHRGPFFAVETGISGVQLSGGWAVLVGERRGNEHYLADVYVGFGVRGVLLRTFESSSLEPAGQTFLGVEGDFTITSVNFSLGVLRGVVRGPGDDRWIVTGGLGWGF